MARPIPIRRLFESHLTVSDLQRSVSFYRDLVADLTIKCATHSRSNGGRKIRGRACPKPIPTGFHAFHGPDFLPRKVRLCVPEFMARSVW